MDRFQGCSTGIVLRVGYGWNEATQHACAIGRLAMEFGLSAVISSTLAIEAGVNETFDDRVVSSLRTPAAKWLKANCSDVVWFDVRKDEARTSRRAGLRNTLVLLHSSWIDGLLSATDLYDAVVVMSSDDQQKLKKSLDAKIIPTMCAPGEVDNQPNVRASLWIVDTATLKKYGSGLLHTLGLLLDYQPELKVTLMCQGSWDNAIGKLVAAMQVKYGDRVLAVKRVSDAQRQAHYETHGSVVNLSCFNLTGFQHLECLVRRRPLAAFHYGIPGRIMTSCPGAWQLPCSVEHTSHGVPEATISFSTLLESLNSFYTLLASDSLPGYSRQSEAYVAARRTKFKAAWEQLWQLQ